MEDIRSDDCVVEGNHLLNLICNHYSIYNNFNDHIEKVSVHEKIKNIIETMSYKNSNSPLSKLSVEVNEHCSCVIISVSNISENLKYQDPHLNRVLHQSKCIVFDKRNYKPLFYIENHMNDSHMASFMNNTNDLGKENSYLNKHLYKTPIKFKEKEFDHNIISCYTNHTGSYIVLFFCNGDWMFYFECKVYKLCVENHAVLYDHIKNNIGKLNKNYCYHCILVDTRLRIPLQTQIDDKFMSIIKINKKYTLQELHHPIHDKIMPPDIFVENKRLYFSCFDEMDFYLEELNNINTKYRKLFHRGVIVKIKIDENDPLYVTYDTCTYKRLKNMIPDNMSIHEAHLHLYQNDKLNTMLQYVEESDNQTMIVTRINLSIVTLGREILDIYHLTRNRENPSLFNILSQSYCTVIHNLHGRFIEKKNKYIAKMNARKNEVNESNMSDVEKISITTEDVYTTLKNMETQTLVELFIDREKLKNQIKTIREREHNYDYRIINIIKNCNSTNLQAKLLEIGRQKK